MLTSEIREVPNAATRAAMLEAKRVRARYDTAKRLFDGVEGKRTKKRQSHKAVR